MYNIIGWLLAISPHFQRRRAMRGEIYFCQVMSRHAEHASLAAAAQCMPGYHHIERWPAHDALIISPIGHGAEEVIENAGMMPTKRE